MLLLPLTILSSITAASDLALYWGQASAGSEKSLGSYCETGAGDIYVISFINEFGGGRATSLNVAGHSGAISELSIPTIGNDIEKCQKLGKKVLLSLGGAAGTYGFNSNSNAEEVANELWNAFGGGHGVNRPFGDAKIDGFDLDIENEQDAEQYVAFVDELRSLYAKDSSKSYYTSAAPQCPFPDASSGKAIAGAHMDFLFIQFYNNYCSLEGSNFNYDTWQNFASSSSPNPDVKLYVGLPGAKSAAGSGYVTIQEIKSKLSSFAGSANFGGFMAWDASQANQNTVNGETFAEQLVKLPGGSSPGPASSSSSSTSKAATSSSTSSSHSEAPTTSSTSSKVWWTPETSTSASSAPSTSSSSSWTDTWWTPHAWWTPAASTSSTSSKESSTESVSTSSSTSSSSSSVSTSTSPKSDSFSISSSPTSTLSSTSNAPTSTTTSSTEWSAPESSSSSSTAQITSSIPASTSSSKTTSVESSTTTSPKSSSSSWSDTWWTPEASKSTSSVSSESAELSTEAPISASSSSSQVWWTPEASSTVEHSTSTASSSTPKWSTKASTEPTTTSSSNQWWTPEATKPTSTHTSVTTSPSTWSSSSEPITSLYEVTSDGTIYVYQTTFNTVYTTVN